MSLFKSPDMAERARERLEASGSSVDRLFAQGFGLSPNPDLSLTNLERWLRAVSNPAPYLDQLEHSPMLARLLMVVLGASQPLTDALIQNPELGSILLDPAELGRRLTESQVYEDGLALLASATSPSHSLDRLRYLKQRWTLPIVLNDLAGNWPEPAVWDSLSQLARALVRLAIRVAWTQSPLSQSLGPDCPFMVVSFGKLGGSELNYSSDIDLVYVAPDGLPEELSREAQRFFEAFGRAMSEPMGRGFLYRVDLRLRPYGASGPILQSMRAVQNYYRLYAEPWEIQALLRSKPVYGPPELQREWESLRESRCFGARLSEASLDSLAQMKTRIEERADTADLKRGSGGIRDVEFLTQILQLAHGSTCPAVRSLATLDALRALEEENLLDHSVASALAEGYVFLRQLEHRCQLVADQQTHAIPESSEARATLANLMGAESWRSLARDLDLHRRTIGTLYQSIVHPALAADTHRSRVGERLGPFAPGAFQWFDALPDSEGFYEALDSNEGSLARVHRVLEAAPALVGAFRRSVTITELLLSGEIEEDFDPRGRIEGLHVDTPLPTLSSVVADAHARLAAMWLLDPTFDLSDRLCELMDAVLIHCVRRLYAEIDVLALGSYGRMDVGLSSDADVVLLVADPGGHAEAEQQAQGLLSIMHTLKRHGCPVEIDLRLRPEGRQGLLVRTYDGVRAYELERMEMWERFALGSSRLVRGSTKAREVLLRAAYAMPLTPERLKELTTMKKRIEAERVQPQHRRRNVKLGHGGLGDIEWFVHLHEMRYPTATQVGENPKLEDGIRALGRARLINAVETEQLLAALHHMQTVRFRLALLGFKDDLVPENPDKLDRLAHAWGDKDGNAFLERHEHMIDTVRAIYVEGMERLRA